MSKSDKIVHGMKLTRAWFPPRPHDVVEQYWTVIRGVHFLIQQRMSPGSTYKDWEAHEWDVDGLMPLPGGMIEFSRTLSTMVQFLIDGVELRHMERLKPPCRSLRDIPYDDDMESEAENLADGRA